jgi:hypothetical protein
MFDPHPYSVYTCRVNNFVFWQSALKDLLNLLWSNEHAGECR